jgi:hypothetical protein
MSSPFVAKPMQGGRLVQGPLLNKLIMTSVMVSLGLRPMSNLFIAKLLRDGRLPPSLALTGCELVAWPAEQDDKMRRSGFILRDPRLP